MSADLVLVGGRVRTGGETMDAAVAFTDGVISAIGDDTTVRASIGRGTEVVDARGATVVPGLTDAHVHVVQGALFGLGTDLRGCSSLDDVRAALGKSGPDRHGWIRGFGLDPNVFGREPVSAAPLETALRGVPTVIRLMDAHSMLVNSAVVTAAGITGREQVPGPAQVAVDAHGAPTGHLLEEAAMALLDDVMPAPAAEDRDAAVRRVVAGMAATGLTGGHVMDDLPGTLEALAAVDSEPGLRWRVHSWVRPDDSDEHIDEVIARITGPGGGRRWRHAGVKMFLDGTVEGGTAWLSTPDDHGKNATSTWPEPGRYRDVVRRLDRAGIRTATHAIGDAAVAHAVAAFAAATSDPGRHRIEHLETVPPPTLSRIARLGVVASMQPTHCTRTTCADGSDMWSRRLGAPRVAQGWPIGTLRSLGATVALGSDWPVVHFDPREVMAEGVLRRPVDAVGDRPRQPDQAITTLQALEGYTSHAARAVGEANAGALAVGNLADVTVLAADPVELAPSELAEVDIVATVVDGRVVYHR